jgi:hypothetical protein
LGKREQYVQTIEALVREEGLGALEGFLTGQSGLPGKRANLELAAAFADYFATHVDLELWNVVQAWIRISLEDAPTDSPREFLPFCAVQALGAVYSRCDPVTMGRIFSLFAAAAEDPRWRMREAVAMALQRASRLHWDDVRILFEKWVQVGTPLFYRAVAATLAEPDLLKDPDRARAALRLSEKILRRISNLPVEARRTEDYRTLVKGMSYALSVFAAALPDEGFALLEKWAVREDPDIQMIIRENLKKNRLVKTYPERVMALVPGPVG